jgi:hypothetical protein
LFASSGSCPSSPVSRSGIRLILDTVENIFIFAKAVFLLSFWIKICGQVKFDPETALSQAVDQVVAIDPHVSLFSKSTLAIFWIAEGGIFEGGVIESKRSSNDGPTLGSENAEQFLQRGAIFSYLFQDVDADDGVD